MRSNTLKFLIVDRRRADQRSFICEQSVNPFYKFSQQAVGKPDLAHDRYSECRSTLPATNETAYVVRECDLDAGSVRA